MTLLEDLEGAAQILDLDASHVERLVKLGMASATSSHAEGTRAFAARLRAHAERLRVEYACAVEKSLLPHSSGRTKALVARINNGPVR